MTDVSAIHYPLMPTKLIVKHRYETFKKLTAIRCPIIIIHSRNDEVIPFAQSQRNFSIANEPKQFIEIKGGHGSGFLLSKQTYVTELNKAFKRFL